MTLNMLAMIRVGTYAFLLSLWTVGACGHPDISVAPDACSGLDCVPGPDAGSATPDAAPPDAAPEVCECDQNLMLSDYCAQECAAAFEVLFADTQFVSFYLTIPDDNGVPGESSWELLDTCTVGQSQQIEPPAHCDYQIGTFHAEYDPDPDDGMDELVTTPEIEVGIRRKGRASWRNLDDKPSLKVKFTEFGSERFMGLTRLTLNNMVQDPSMMRERLSYRIYRALGATASLANSARVYVRRNAAAMYEYYGVYANVQSLDKRFVEYNYGTVLGQVGNLYDTYNHVYFTDLDRSSARSQAGTAPGAQEARFQLETNKTTNDTSDLTAAIDAVYAASITNDNSNFVEGMEPILDVDGFLRVFAAMAVITDWDGFAGTRNNYKLYHDLVSDRFSLFPWGTDQTFGWQDNRYYPNWDYNFDHSDARREASLFSKRCAADPDDCYVRYLAIAQSAIDDFEQLDLATAIDAIQTQTESAALADTRKPYSDAQYRRGILYVRHYLEHRAACAQGQMQGVPCAPVSCPPGSGGDCRP